MRKTTVISISLPSAMLTAATRFARRHHMTRSEYLRASLRRHMEEELALEAIRISDQEEREGKLQKLGSEGLAGLMLRLNKK